MRELEIQNVSPEAWLEQTFDCPAVHNGKVFRVSQDAVERTVGLARFKEEVTGRGFRALANNGAIVVFCNAEPVEILVSGGPK